MTEKAINAARYRRIALCVALFLAMVLLALDRTAAYLHRPAADASSVVIYTTQWCPYCTRLRAYLDDQRIPYREYDVENSFQGGMGFWTLRGRGVPLLVIGPEIIYGFDMERIGGALTRLGYKIGDQQDGAGMAQPPAFGGGASPL